MSKLSRTVAVNCMNSVSNNIWKYYVAVNLDYSTLLVKDKKDSPLHTLPVPEKKTDLYLNILSSF